MGNVLSFGRYKGQPTKLDVSTMKLVAKAVCSGDFGEPGNEFDRELDPDRAADELRKAGYEVFRLQVVDVVWCEVEDIVHNYGGTCHECGRLEPGEAPFAELFC